MRYLFQNAFTAFIRRRFSVVTSTVVVASDACPRFCCAISIGIPLAIAWLARECRIQCVLAFANRSAPFASPCPRNTPAQSSKNRLIWS